MFGNITDDPAMAEFVTPAMRQNALSYGLAQAAQAVGGAQGGRRFGSYLGDAMGGFGTGYQSSLNNSLSQQGVLSGLLDDRRKRKEQDRLDAQRKKREKLFGDYRSGAIKGPLPPDVQKVMDQVYDIFGEEKASEFLLNYLEEDAKASLGGSDKETWNTLAPEDLATLAKERNIHLDPNEMWQMSNQGQIKSVGKVKGAAADISPEAGARLALAEGFVNDYEGQPLIEGDVSLKKLLQGDDEVDEDGNVIADRPGIADWVGGPGGINTSRLFNMGEWHKFERRMFTGAEALVRMLTGAGMNMGEAEDRAANFLPRTTDSAATIQDKAARLAANLKNISVMVRSGGRPEDYLERLRREMDADQKALSPAARKQRLGG
jgi:hypothetical protein